jgi:outer membrane protein OmpA-like peptidoglycan-associated protein
MRYGKILIVVFTIALGIAGTLQAQSKSEPEWWYGGALGINVNYYGGEVHQLNATTLSINPFTKGAGKGFYLAPLIEYHPDPVWGGMLQLGFDSRSGSFDEVGNGSSTASASATVNYLSIEPNLRVSPFSSPLYFFAGPRIAFNISNSFSYKQSGNSDVAGDWSGNRGAVMSGQVGFGYDIPLTNPVGNSQVKLSPFLAVHFGQGPRSEESWSLSTIRFGVALKFGSSAQAHERLEGEVGFTVKAPKLIPIERKVRETFPVRNYVFFDEGSNTIPNRYILLTKGAAADFKEEQLLQPEPKDLTGRSRRQLKTYYNVLNILGDRMRANHGATVTLVGSSEQGAANGKELAETVKRYLVDVFDVDATRIKTEGRDKPLVPSVQPGGTRELDLVRPEDRRVDITSTSSGLLEPIQIVSLQEDPLDSDVLFTVAGAQDALSSWSVEVTDDAGSVKRFGPYTSEQERVSGRTILGSAMKGQYKIAMIGETKNGQSVRREESVRLVRSDQPDVELGLRFSIVFEFDQSKTVATYERFLTETVSPLIPEGASVIIHGHTDIVGEESHNLKLSRDRAQETMSVIQRALGKAGKRRVKFDTYGFGEDVRRAPFENHLPEERFYNRTVIIDIVPE